MLIMELKQFIDPLQTKYIQLPGNIPRMSNKLLKCYHCDKRLWWSTGKIEWYRFVMVTFFHASEWSLVFHLGNFTLASHQKHIPSRRSYIWPYIWHHHTLFGANRVVCNIMPAAVVYGLPMITCMLMLKFWYYLIHHCVTIMINCSTSYSQ